MALKVLSALDTAKTQYYHFKAIIVAGMGLFSDAYDLFCIPPIMRLIARIYYPTDHGQDEKQLYEIPSVIASTMIGIALLGAVFGNLVFGRLGDMVGRRRVYGVSLLLMVMSSVGCGLSMSTSTGLVLASLGFFRFMLGIGIGIGGDYPLSATIMSEFANRRTRGAFIAAVFSMQGFGILLSSIVTMTVCAVFQSASGLDKKSKHVPAGADVAWRLILMIGAIPAAMTYYWRMKMPETARYTALVEKNALQAAKDMEKVLNVSLSQIAEDVEVLYTPTTASNNTYPFFSKEFLRRHGRDLFASSASWFLLDIVFYSLNLFSTHAFRPYIPLKRNTNAFEDAFYLAKFQAIVAICSTIPGYFATVYLIDHIGRVRIQIMGFFCMAVSLVTIGLVYRNNWDSGSTNFGFMILYGLTFFFSNFGPNTTTFIVPAELFPARFRATCHGISGAAGKVGAIIGAVGFLWASREDPNGIGMTWTLMILGGVYVIGMVVTYFFTRETMGRSLEDNENQDEYSGVCFLRCLPKGSCLKPESSVNTVSDAA